MYLSNSIYIQSIMQANSERSGFIQEEENELKRLRNERKILEEESIASTKFLELLEDEVSLLSNQLEQYEKQFLDKQQKQISGNSNHLDYFAKESENFISGASLNCINKLQEELQLSLKKLEESFEERKKFINEKIQKEVDKIGSGGLKGTNNPMKKMHIILIADESGSMSGNWTSVCETMNNFIAHFATTDDESHLFSIILFDNSCRYHAKREKASNIQKLPNLSSGGTNYGQAFQMGSKFVDITPSEYAPVIIFMTDGKPQDGVKQSLTELKNCSQKPNFKFFGVGFGTAYNKDILIQLSNAGNNDKQSFQLGQKDFKFVYDALDNDALQKVFDIFQENFDFAAQENAIAGLKKQLAREENEFLNLSDFFTKLNQKKVQNMKSQIKQYSEFKDLSIEDKEKNYANLLTSQISTITKEKSKCQEQIRIIEGQIAKLQAAQNQHVELLSSNLKKIETFEKKLEESKKVNQDTVKKHKQAIEKLKQDTGFVDIQQIGQFSHSLTHIEGLIQNLMNITKDCKNLITTFSNKIKDLISMFQKQKQNATQRKIDINLLIQGLKDYEPSLNVENRSPQIILEDLLNQQNKMDYDSNMCYYKPILKNVDLLELARADRKQISTIAKCLSKELIVKDKNMEDKSDSDSNSNEEEQKQSDEEDEEDVRSFMNGLSINKDKIPTTISKIQSEIKSAETLKKQLKKDKKSLTKSKKSEAMNSKEIERLEKISSQLTQINARLEFLDELSNPEVLQIKIKTCLLTINEIIQKAFGNEMKKQFKNNFRILFQSFGNDIKKTFISVQNSNELLQIESMDELKAAIQENKFVELQIEDGKEHEYEDASMKRLEIEM